MLSRTTIRQVLGTLAVLAVGAGLLAENPKARVDSKSVSSTKGSPPVFENESFTEPYRTAQVATTDMGVVREVLIREGDTVEAGQALVRLDDDLISASVEIARQNASSRGTLTSAEAELRLQTSRLEKLESLLTNGHARPDEVEKARLEKEIAAARVLAAQEALAVRQRELDRCQTEFERRTVRAPLSGVVIKIHRELGEFVAPTDPVVVTIVQLDPLLATFSLAPAVAAPLRTGQTAPVQFASGGSPAQAEVEFVSPVMDARSGTVRVKVRIPNSNGQYRSGDRCSLLPAPRSVAQQTDRQPLDGPTQSRAR